MPFDLITRRRRGFSSAAGLLCTIVAAAAALTATPLAFADPAPQFNPPKKYYLALGDSVAYGFQRSKFVADLPPSGYDTGYVDVFAARLRAIRPDISVVNFGCPGESTRSFQTGPCFFAASGNGLHDNFEGSQLDAAVAFLAAHRGQVSPITVTLWGNDVIAFLRSCGGDFGCILVGAPAEIAGIAKRLGAIVGELRAAAPDAEIIVTGPWNSNVGFFPESDPLIQALNGAMASASAANGARFADTFPIFNPQGDLAAETAAICTLTLICTEGDSHPSDAGYQAIADVVLAASGYGRLAASGAP